MVWAKYGAVFMFLAVALGAFGAHALKGKLSEYGMDIYKTAVIYHMAHALALFAVAWLTTVKPQGHISMAGCFFTAGIILFSGSLYLLSLTSIKWIGAITPLGGVAFLAGWLWLLFKI